MDRAEAIKFFKYDIEFLSRHLFYGESITKAQREYLLDRLNAEEMAVEVLEEKANDDT